MQSIFAFSLGGPEVFIVIFAILLLFGAKKIPELARGMGKGIREFKDATKEIKNEIEEGGVSEDDQPTKK
jgi:sec-independent protein translocase protein TatA